MKLYLKVVEVAIEHDNKFLKKYVQYIRRTP